MNIFDAFRLQAKFQPTAPAICAPGRALGLVSYGRLEALANNAARHALIHGVKRGDTVAVICADPVLHWILVLGLGRIGATSLSSVVPSVPAECNVGVAITDTGGGVQNAARVLVADQGWIAGDGAPPPVDVERDTLAIARIILTSGTTGHPKGVALSHEMIVRRLFSFNVAFGSRIPACTRSFLDPGIAANFGFLWGIYTLSRGGALFLRGRDPAETLQALTLYNVQCMIASPGGLAEILDYYERSPAFSSPFEVVMSIASMLVKPLADRVRAIAGLEPHRRLRRDRRQSDGGGAGASHDRHSRRRWLRLAGHDRARRRTMTAARSRPARRGCCGFAGRAASTAMSATRPGRTSSSATVGSIPATSAA